MAPVRYLITGGSGYIGSRLTEILAARDDVEEIVALDVRPPASPRAKTTFVRGDVREAGAIRELLEREQPDALIHLAFVLNPIHDEARMYDIDASGRRHDDLAGVGGADRPQDPRHVDEDDPPHLRRGMDAPCAAGRVAAGQPQLHPLSVGGLEREAQERDRLAADGHDARGLRRDDVREGARSDPQVRCTAR